MQVPNLQQLDSTPLHQNLGFWALLIAAAALAVSIYAITVSKRTARRTGVIDLHEAWAKVNELDPHDLVGPDVRAAVNALDLTAAVWNHDVIDKNILFQSYWPSVKDLYETLTNINRVVPGYRKTGRECLTPNVKRAYQDMERWELRLVKQTRL